MIDKRVRMDEQLKLLYIYILKHKWYIGEYSVFPDGSIYVGIKQHEYHKVRLVFRLTPFV